MDVGGEGSTFNNALDFIECSTTAEPQMFMKLRVDHLTGKKLARRFRYSQSGIAKGVIVIHSAVKNNVQAVECLEI